MATKRKAHETDESKSDSDSGVSKAKAKKYSQKFRGEYSKDFPGILASSRGRDFAFCSMCNLHFKISHGGKNDVKRHMLCEKHKANSASGSSERITQFFQARSAPAEEKETKEKLELDITRAEATMCSIITDCNLALATADKLTAAMQFMFPDSKIASGKSCNYYLKILLANHLKVYAC